MHFATPPTDSSSTLAPKAGTRSPPAGAVFGPCADSSMFETRSLFLPRHDLAHRAEFPPVEDVAGGTGRLRLDRSTLGTVTGDARRDAGDEDVAAGLRMPRIMAMVAFDRRVLGMIEASRRQKAREHHDRRDMERTAGTVGDMAVNGTTLFVEDDADR